MPKHVTLAPKSYPELADFYHKLAKLEDAGFPPGRAIAMAAGKEANALPWQLAIEHIDAGQPLAEVLNRTGAFPETDITLVNAWQSAGKLVFGFRWLAEHYQAKSRRWRKLKSQLALPTLVLILGLFIQPLPGLFTGALTINAYLAQSLGLLLKLSIVVFLVLKLPFWLTQGWLKPLRLGFIVYRLEMLWPDMALRYQHRFIQTLAILLSAGVSAEDALAEAGNTWTNPYYRRQLGPALEAVKQGQSLATALAPVTFFQRSLIGWIDSGERSGKLAHNLMHLSRQTEADLALSTDHLFEWLPRLIYFAVLAWLGMGFVA